MYNKNKQEVIYLKERRGILHYERGPRRIFPWDCQYMYNSETELPHSPVGILYTIISALFLGGPVKSHIHDLYKNTRLVEQKAARGVYVL